MDALSLPLVGALAVLALVDGTSFGTLGVPLLLLARPQVRVRGVLTFLAAIAAFYWVLGLLLFGLLATLLPSLRAVGDSTPVLWAQLVVGVVLLLASFLFDGPGGRWRRARRERSGRPSRTERLGSRLAGPEQRAGALVVLALGAGAVEAATMVPYLAALGILTTSGIAAPVTAAVLLGYAVLMIAPALVLTALRILLAGRMEPHLARMSAWFSRRADELIAWTLGIAGFLVARDAVVRIWGLDF